MIAIELPTVNLTDPVKHLTMSYGVIIGSAVGGGVMVFAIPVILSAIIMFMMKKWKGEH